MYVSNYYQQLPSIYTCFSAAPLQVSILSSGMNTSQESILLDLSALDSNSSSKGAHESLEERNKGVSLIGKLCFYVQHTCISGYLNVHEMLVE